MGDVSNEVILNAILDLKGDVGGLVAQVRAQGENLANHIQDDIGLSASVAKINTTLAEKRGATRLAHALYVGVGTIGGAIAGFIGHRHG